MNEMTEDQLDQHRRDLEAGNIIRNNPAWDPGQRFDVSGVLESHPDVRRSDTLQQDLNMYRAAEADGIELSDYEIDCMALLEAELIVVRAEEELKELAEEYPEYIWSVGEFLYSRLDELQVTGAPVDEEMYLEAGDLADEIINANPDKNEAELIKVLEAAVDAINAQRTFGVVKDELDLITH